MAQQQINIVSGPSGVGKDTLVELLVERVPSIYRTKSWTTRSQKSGENGKYHHVSEEGFEAARGRQEFAECAKVHGFWYGTPKSEIEGRPHVLLEIDCQGAETVKKQYPHAHSIFILPPSREVLKARLEGRRRENDLEVHRRLLRAAMEIGTHAEGFDSWVVNGDDRTVTAANLILLVNQLRKGQQPESFYRDKTILAQVKVTFPSYACDPKFF